jgi:hypothetical protein
MPTPASPSFSSFGITRPAPSSSTSFKVLISTNVLPGLVNTSVLVGLKRAYGTIEQVAFRQIKHVGYGCAIQKGMREDVDVATDADAGVRG